MFLIILDMNYCCWFCSPVGGLFAVNGQRVSSNRTIPPSTLCCPGCYSNVLPELNFCFLFSAGFHLTLSTELRKFVSNDEGNWTEGQRKCVVRGGHLVTLHNRYDVQLIHKLINKPGATAYLGLHEKKHANRSEWSNGDEMTNWTEANITYEQKCVAIQNNEWREQPCNETMYFMCYNACK